MRALLFLLFAVAGCGAGQQTDRTSECLCAGEVGPDTSSPSDVNADSDAADAPGAEAPVTDSSSGG